jgi:type II secretory pathway component PulJ
VTRRRQEGGFTLVEATVAGALLVVCLASGLQFFVNAFSGASALERSTQVHADARFGTDRLVRELRQAYTGDPATSPVSAITARSLTFDTPGTRTPFVLRRMAYRINGGFLERSTTSSTTTSGPPWTFGTTGAWVQVMAVRDADAFVGRTSSGAATTDPTAVRSVDITFAVPSSKGRTDRTFRTSVTLRNAR